MKIHANQLKRYLKDPIQPLYWVAGDEMLLVQDTTDALRQFLHRRGYEEREIWHVDTAMDWQALLLSANSLSLFSEKKRLELRFSSGKPGDKALRALAEYSAAPNPDCVILASGPKIDSAAARGKTFKQLDSTCLLVQVWPVDSNRLPEWISAQVQDSGRTLSPEALQLLTERVEGNLLAARQEVNKLLLLTEPGQRIDADAVTRSVADSSRHNVFEVSEAILSGDPKRSLRLINGLKEEGVEPTALLWAITRDLRQLIHLRQALNQGQRPERAMEKLGIWKKHQQAFGAAAQRLNQGELEAALEIARSVDLSIKGLEQHNPWDQLRALASLLSGRPLSPLLRARGEH